MGAAGSVRDPEDLSHRQRITVMFFLFFGYGTRIKVLGEAAGRRCARCHNDVRPLHTRSNRYLSLFFVPVLRWHRRELDTCPICGHAEPHAAPATGPARRHRPAPVHVHA